MKKRIYVVLCALILFGIALCSCVKQPDSVLPIAQPSSTAEPAVTQTPTQSVTPTETQVATQEIKGATARFSVLNDSTNQWRTEETSIFISKNLKAHLPIKENGYWVLEDKFGHITNIKQINVDSNTVSFTIERIGGKANRVTVSLGSLILLFFIDIKQPLADMLNYDPTGDQFVSCDFYTALPCFIPPSIVFLTVRETGVIKKDYDETDKLWCTDLGAHYELRLGNLEKSDPLTTSTAYKLPGNKKIYNWIDKCPTVTIEEIK